MDHCNCVGIIDVDLEAIAFDIGSKVDQKHLTELLGRVESVSESKLFIPKFIQFQYGALSESCPAHKPVLKLVTQLGLILSENGYSYPNARVSVTLQDIYKEKEPDKERKGAAQGEIGIVVKSFSKPTLEMVKLHAVKIGLPDDEALKFFHFYESNGWKVGKNPMKSWQSAMINWRTNWQTGVYRNKGPQPTGISNRDLLDEAMR